MGSGSLMPQHGCQMRCGHLQAEWSTRKTSAKSCRIKSVHRILLGVNVHAPLRACCPDIISRSETARIRCLDGRSHAQ